MENTNKLNQWANFPVMLNGRRVLFSTTQDPDTVLEGLWKATSPNGDYARLIQPLKLPSDWHKISEISLRDVLE